jgi:hypothetical protein
MGQCVLKDCGLEHQNPPSHLETALKRHLQDQYFDNFADKIHNLPIKDQDFNTSLDYPKKKTMLPKQHAKRDWRKEKDLEVDDEKLSNEDSKPELLNTKKITPLIHKENDEKSPEFQKFVNQNYINPSTSEMGYDEDFLGGSLSYNNEDLKKNANKRQKSLKPSIDQSQTGNNMSSMFQNQIFENVNTTSALNYRSDEENLGEYEKIFQDDEFMDSDSDEDYVKKLKNG